jgi:hypothetical protein
VVVVGPWPQGNDRTLDPEELDVTTPPPGHEDEDW